MTDAAKNLLSTFQSLGDNCEFGWVQKHFDSLALDLLRWAGVEYNGLINGLDHDFDGLFELENLLPVRERLVADKHFGIIFHTQLLIGLNDHGKLDFLYQDMQELRAAHEKEAGRIRFMIRKFLEDLDNGDKIYLFKQEGPPQPQQIEALHSSLSRRRPQRLIWVSLASPALPAEEVRLIAPGVKVAALSRFADRARTDLADFEAWEVICRKATLTPWL